ncbi:MAG: response regulator [Calditrichaeota bacterium]|nr:MAG: response regulator [Calditrichota bacterium]
MAKERVTPKILIVDDEPVVRNVCQLSLEKRGYHVETVENGSRALELLKKGDIDIVFTDIKMPIIDGLELLDTIKRDFPHVEVVIMTGYATIEGAIDAMKKGAYDFILKPIKPDQIRLVTKKCVEKIQLSEENRTLRLANQKLQELQEMKDKFLAITSHELRTPVSHLKGYLGILGDEIYDQLSESDKKQCIQVLNNAVQELEDIVARMHNLSQIENGKHSNELDLVDVNKIIEKIVEDYRIISRQRNQSIKFSKTIDPLSIVVDPKQIKCMVSELIQNAIKFTPDGGEVLVTTKIEGEYCIISVKDNGVGVESSKLGKIFEKFYEAQDSKYHSSSKSSFMGGGLGLGLPSVRAMAVANGGGVKVKSEQGKGSEFSVYLPLEKNGK